MLQISLPRALLSSSHCPSLAGLGSLLVVLLLLSSTGFGQVKVRTLDQSPFEARVLGIDSSTLSYKSGAASPQSVELSRLVSLTFDEKPIRIPSSRSGLLQFDIAGGDRLYGEIIDSNDDEVRVSTQALGPVSIAYEHLSRVLVLRNLRGRESQLVGSADQERDLLFVESRDSVDRVVGDLGRFKKGGVDFQWNEQGESPFDFKADKVLAICLSDVEPPARPKGVYAVAWFQDGSRLTGAIRVASNGAFSMQFGVGKNLTLKPEALQQLSFRGGDFVYLSDLKLPIVKETPYLEGGLTYGLSLDRGLGGAPVSVGRVFFEKALAVHSRTHLTYRVPKGYDYFACAVGIDESVAKRSVKGAVTFRVRKGGGGDGVLIGKAVTRRAGEPAVWLEKIAVKPAELLVLEADFADRAHFNGWAVWGSPMFWKTRR